MRQIINEAAFPKVGPKPHRIIPIPMLRCVCGWEVELRTDLDDQQFHAVCRCGRTFRIDMNEEDRDEMLDFIASGKVTPSRCSLPHTIGDPA